MRFTILGAQGFIGSHLASFLESQGVECFAPARDQDLHGCDLGHVFYCIGLTADFRTHTFGTVEAHVCALLNILRYCRYESLLYFSSTRVYKNARSTHEETILRVNPGDPDDLYDISKIMGESLCLTLDNPQVRVVRLSNVIGPNPGGSNFVNAMIAEALTRGRISLQVSPESEKDYIAIEDIVEILPRIVQNGRQRIYNVASGVNRTHGALAALIAKWTGCTVEEPIGGSTIAFQPIDVRRMIGEFSISPSDIEKSLVRAIRAQEKELGKISC